ncbi:hypothetical protein ACIA5D_17820 [Actinoplanes sp. NPDC051513]|uniref:recombination directionality factor n=1 Tax=Actinoplanes sp. NPDC051513 TaxID=3363908 RepID=UPI003798558B
MAIKDLQKRFTLVGVIRLGEQRISKNNKPYPAKLETFRITSPSRALVEAVADLYGGQVQPWASNTGPQWQVVTGVSEIPVMVPPQRIDPNMEHWGNGYRDRLCDGETEKMRDKPCLCAAAVQAGQPFGPREVCKPTTRMSLMLGLVPSLGTFKLESHGWNAAAELPMLANAIEQAPEPVPAVLRVEKREKNLFHPDRAEKDQIEARVFMVPVLIFDWLTPAQAFGGELGTAARNALAGATAERHAIEVAKTEEKRPKLTAEEYASAATDAIEVEDVRGLWTLAGRDGVLTDALKKALTARVAELTRDDGKPKPQAPTAEAQNPTPPPVDDVIDVEVEPNADEVWGQIQASAGDRKWSTKDLEQRVDKFLGKSSGEADGFELARFLRAVQAGEVA